MISAQNTEDDFQFTSVLKDEIHGFGSFRHVIATDCLVLNGRAIDLVKEWKYLGFNLNSFKGLVYSLHLELSSFYHSAN